MNAAVDSRYQTLEELSAGLEEYGNLPPEWYDKMIHKIPEVESVDRVKWLLERCQGKVAVHVGAGGRLHTELQKVCKHLYGVDKEPLDGCVQVDLDWGLDVLPVLDDVELVLLPEVLEHLVNPGFLLRILREHYPTQPFIVTVPNAFSLQPRLARGIETVNGDHNCWYSYWTMKTLLYKCGLGVDEWFWYNGSKYVAEGLIFVAS
jgi:hypothetical protein